MAQITVKDGNGSNATAALVPNTGPGVSAVDALPVVRAGGTVITGPAAQAAVTNNALDAGGASSNTGPFQCGALQVTSTATGGTWIAEQSIDGVSWTPCPLVESAVGNPTPIVAAVTATAATRMFRFSNLFPLFRIRIATALTGGTAQFFAALSQTPFATPVLPVVNATAANFQATVTGTVTATVANATLAAGTAAVGDVGVQYRASAAGAATQAKIVSAASTNPTVVKAAAGRLLGFDLANTTASWRYLKLHNVAAAPTAGTTPVVTPIAIPPNGKASFEADGGAGFATGIAYTIVTGSADADATAVAAGDVVGFLLFA